MTRQKFNDLAKDYFAKVGGDNVPMWQARSDEAAKLGTARRAHRR
jgi:hypothetical protein